MILAIVVALLVGTSPAHAETTLCEPDEVVVLSCHIGVKVLSLCRPQGDARALRFRLGRPGRVALRYPAPDAPGTFVRSEGPLIGGGETRVTFADENATYSIFSRVARADGVGSPPEFEDGLILTIDGERPRTKVCDDGGEGFRESVEWLAVAPE